MRYIPYWPHNSVVLLQKYGILGPCIILNGSMKSRHCQGALWRLASKLIISESLVEIQREYSLAFVVGEKHHDLYVLIKCSFHFYRTFNNEPYLKYIGLISWLSQSIN